MFIVFFELQNHMAVPCTAVARC